MFDLFRLWLGAVLRGFRTRRSLMLENLALRQQLAVLKRKQPRPRLGAIDKLFWVVARRFWAQWKEALVVVLPDTVARWHRSGFKLYWAMLCKVRNPVGGGRRISQQIRELIFQMVADNPRLGCASHPWRTPDARLRSVGNHHFPLDETSAQRTLNPRSAGWPFCAIIGKLSRPWISSPSPLSPLGFCTASSSSAMIADAFCTSTSLATPLAAGPCSGCEKLFPTILRPDFFYSTTMRSTAHRVGRFPTDAFACSPKIGCKSGLIAAPTRL